MEKSQQLENGNLEKDSQKKHVIELDIKRRPLVNLHLHSVYSSLDGCGKAEEYVELGKKFNHPAIACTDHGNMSGTFEFYKKCKAGGIKPIIGMEAYINDNMGDYEEKKMEGGNCHQVILIKDHTGYVNLNKLIYRSFTEGYYKRGRIKTEWLIENKEGLFITSSCLASVMSKHIMAGKEQSAEDYLSMLVKEFADDFAIELQFNESDEQKIYNAWLLKMAKKYNVLVIITNDVHYADKDGAKLQDTMIAIQQKSELSKSFKLSTRHLYYPNAEDIHKFNKMFGYNYPEHLVDEWISNTLIVAEKCNFEFDTKTEKYPKYEPDQEVIDYFKTNDVKEIITRLSHAKLKQKIAEYKKNGIITMTPEKEKEYYDRLNYELKVIDEKNALDYFMIYWELIRDYKKHGLVTGPGRGCMTPNDQVVMSDGLKKSICDITPGEEVIDAYGEIKKVLTTFEYDIDEDICELKFDNGGKAHATLDHKFLTENRGWVKAGELMPDDEVKEI